MTCMLDKLESKGLLARSRSVDDRRMVNLTLTEKGMAVAERIPEARRRCSTARLKMFSLRNSLNFAGSSPNLRIFDRFFCSFN
ncbi:MarR family transcriptional regulator [Cupriavidus basilensis]